MTHFEYISVAIALVNALVVSRLLRGITASLRPDAFYFTHFAWLVTLILITVMQWWSMWGAREVEWTALKFIWILGLPSILFLRSGVLLSEHPEEIESFENYFFESRIAFFSLGLLTSFWVSVTPWILGIFPWFTITQLHMGSSVLMGLSIVGLISKGRLIHTILALLFMVAALLNFFTFSFEVHAAIAK
ncbi:MAG: hypothetical protein ACI9FR_000200 [Cryomorphaceae bacterium]|jgi:hypothetical protein